MIKFIETIQCTPRHNCHVCRSPGTSGQEFRGTLGQVYEMPGPGLFVCPFGITESTAPKPPPPPPPPPEVAELRTLMHDHHGDGAELLGDRVEAWAKKWGMDKAAAAWEKWTGLPCGCSWRKKMLNELNGLWRGVRAKITTPPKR